MRPDKAVNPWHWQAPTRHRGGRIILPRHHAPLGQLLPYRRAAGQHPPVTGLAESLPRTGFQVILGSRGLGDTLLALALLRAFTDATDSDAPLYYTGPRPELMRRCTLPLTTTFHSGSHIVHNRLDAGLTIPAIPEHPPAMLDLLDDDHVEVHAALPMRYYLTAERQLGIRLPASHAPTPAFTSSQPTRPFHVVFVSATSWADRKNYGIDGFARIADTLTRRLSAPWSFTVITGHDDTAPAAGLDVLTGVDATDCLDVFASADIVIGNDTGLTHLAALTQRPDGTGPEVLGIYGRHAHTKWTTGSNRHHALATAFSQMLSAADRCPVRDDLDDTVWHGSADLAAIPAEDIADFAGHLAGWW